ncbi:MAG TPA: hypothetical protein PKD18_15540 [Saprospiraceae bacterium]|nr:hypothetical protein [Saprospiraceae bacterium]
MDTTTAHIDSLHFEHVLWTRQLEFEQDEIKFFNKKLEEVVSRWTDVIILGKVEQFQNQFIRNNEVIDSLRHEIKLHEQYLAGKAVEQPTIVGRILFDNHDDLKLKVETQSKMFTSLRTDFLDFLRQTM